MFDTYEAAVDAIAVQIEDGIVLDAEVAQCDTCNRYGDAEGDEINWIDEPAVWECEDCTEKWQAEAMRDARLDVRGRLDWQERAGWLTLTV